MGTNIGPVTSSTAPKRPRSSGSALTLSAPWPGAVASPPTAPAADGYYPPSTSSAAPNAEPAPRRTIIGVELARTGQFRAATGPLTLTTSDLAAIVDAAAAHVARTPVVKIVHADPRPGFDGEPSLGWIENLRLSPDSQVLLGDLHGVPGWRADTAATAYPSRSMEATRGYVDADGRTWPLVLTGVALLGVTEPAIGSLADLRQFVTLAAGPADTVARRLTAARARRNRLAYT